MHLYTAQLCPVISRTSTIYHFNWNIKKRNDKEREFNLYIKLK